MQASISSHSIVSKVSSNRNQIRAFQNTKVRSNYACYSFEPCSDCRKTLKEKKIISTYKSKLAQMP